MMAIIQRKTVNEVIAERGENVGVKDKECVELKLSERQKLIVSVIKSNATVTVKQPCRAEPPRFCRQCFPFPNKFRIFDTV